MNALIRSVAVALVVALGLVSMDQVRAAFSATTSSEANSVATAGDFSPDPSFRVTTYEIGGFGGTTYTLALDQDLMPDYFVLMRGGAGNYTRFTTRTPAQDYARVDLDPFGNFGASSAADRLRLRRGDGGGTWTGQVTVAECVADCDASGFRLVRVNETTMTSGQTSATDATGAGWTDIAQVAVYGGSYGGGVETTSGSATNHTTAAAGIYPTEPGGAATLNLERQTGGSSSLNGTTTFTTYVVEWGSEWLIQRVRVSGSSGGDGVDAPGEYDTAALAASVGRGSSFVTASGRTADSNLSGGWDGVTWTLGNGVTQAAVESSVAVGAEAAVGRTTETIVHTHPDLIVNYYFGSDNVAPGIRTLELSDTRTVAPPVGSETHSGSTTGGFRMPIVANTSSGGGHAYPRSLVWGQLDSDTTLRWQRSRSGQPGAYWAQVVDFGAITS